MATYTQQQIENVWFALNLNRLKPNNDANSGAGLHNPNGSINMYKWLQDALMLIGGTGSGMNDNIYNADGTLTGTRTLTLDGNSLAFTGAQDSTHEQITVWNPNSVITKVGQTGLLAINDHYIQNTSASVGVVSFSEMTSIFNGSTDIITGYLRTDARGAGFEQVNVSIGVTNQMTNDFIQLIMHSADGIYPTLTLEGLSTNYEYGAASTPKLYMTPTLVNEGTKEIRYTYPLQQHCMAFGDSDHIVLADEYAIGSLATNSNGETRTAVEVLISARSFSTAAVGTLEVTIFDGTDSAWYTKSIDMNLLITGYGKMSEEAITLPLENNQIYTAKVTGATGIAAGIKGLVVILSTI